jgi:DNA-binding transcriptional MerR regulator
MAYPVKIAAELAGLSVSGVKTYSARYKTFLSPSANPGPGLSRSFTPDDVAKLKAIGALAKQGIPSAEILSRLEAGEMADLQPEDASQNVIDGPQATQPQQTAIMLAQSAVNALQAAFEAERAERQALAERLQDAERRAATAEALLQEARKSFWRRLFGG